MLDEYSVISIPVLKCFLDEEILEKLLSLLQNISCFEIKMWEGKFFTNIELKTLQILLSH